VDESAELAASLLAAAGLGSVASLERLGKYSDYSNSLHAVTDTLGDRYVLRQFSEKPPPHTALTRLRRERWVYEMLAAAGVPVPTIAASSEEAGAVAVLMGEVEGEHLGKVVASISPAEAQAAWRSCGKALAAVHAIDAEKAVAAGCETVGIESPATSRGPFHHDEALEHLDRMSAVRPDLGRVDELTAAVSDALPLYERVPLVLCQCDAHLWQFLVRSSPGRGWTCAAILDWEFADLDDPDRDLALLDGFRFEPVAVVPPAFFAGYGRTPTSPLHTLYRLERAAWILAGHAGGAQWLELSVPLAERLVRGLLASSTDLRKRIETAAAS
jgi:aminoglycoside phosphotransferase (APT) family kinase protein